MVDATLRSVLSGVPSKCLDYSSRLVFSKNLDMKQLLTSRSGHLRDYRGLAELMGFEFSDIKMFERHDEPTLKILESWQTRPDSDLGKLVEFLEEMDRYDVVEELVPFLKRNSEAFLERQKVLDVPLQVSEVTSGPLSTQFRTELITCDDLRTGECTFYDAYLCYADEDSSFVQQLSAFLESTAIGLKLFIRGRDMLAGSPELDTNVELIKNRCRKMLIILTENFIHSPQCAFQISFAATLSIEQQKRTLIPILLFPMSSELIPNVLSTVSKIDFTRPCINSWMWQKLIMSLLPQGKQTANWPPPEMLFPRPEEPTKPMITFPETVQLKALPAESTFRQNFMAASLLLPQGRQTANWPPPQTLPPPPEEPTEPMITFPETVQLKALPAESTPVRHTITAESPPPETLPPRSEEPTEPMITFPETVQLKALPAESTLVRHTFMVESPKKVPEKRQGKSRKGRMFKFPFGKKQPTSTSYSTSGYCSGSP